MRQASSFSTPSAHGLETEVQRLAVLDRYAILDTPPERAFDRVTKLAAKVFGVPVALITLIDEERVWFKSCYGLDTRQADRDIAFCSYTIESDEVLVVPDTTKDNRFRDNPLVTGDLHIRFYAGAPLRTPSGYNLGSLCLMDIRPHTTFGVTESEMLTDLAEIVMNELELRRVGRDLRSSESVLSTVVETITDAIYIKDLESRYTLINRAGAAMLGYSVSEVLGRRDADLMGEPEAGHISDVDSRVLETRQPVVYERSAAMANETKVHATSKYPYISPDGQLIGLIGVSRDVTARRRAEQALADSETRYRIVAETASDAIVTIDAESRVLYANSSAEKIFGYTQAELNEMNLTRLMPDYLRRVHEAALKRYVETGVRHMHWEAIEIPGLHKNGTVIPIEVSFGEHHEGGRRIFTGIMRDITERKRISAELEALNHELETRVSSRTSELEEANAQLLHDAFHDKLTGLANRALLKDRLGLALERQQRSTTGGFAVLYLDTDRFKVVNDSLGHAIGDQLLITLGKRLLACVRPGDTVARFGGDEFVILLEDATSAQEVTRIAERIQDEVRKPFSLAGRIVHTSVSIGVVFDHAGDPDTVLRDADIAMYHAKAQGKARYQVFTEAMREHALSLMMLENDLRGALVRSEFRVCYQPIRSIAEDRLTGFEALVRWAHPTLGMISPASFVPLAEETGLIIELDRWVLHQACGQLGEWQRRFPLAPPLTMNVNLSSRQFLESDLTDVVRATLTETGVKPEHLKLEVTESVLMQNSEGVMAAFESLKTLGVKLYVDDFGMGYSSLSYLQHFPVDSLKIDRSFVHNMATSPESAELVRTIIAMARALNLSVVAEGIETEAQLDQLSVLGCTSGQGYLFAKPLEPTEASIMLEGVQRDLVKRGGATI